MKPVVLITERFSLNEELLLKQNANFELIRFENLFSLPADITSRTQGLIIRSQTKVNESLLKALPNLKIIVTGTAGFDHIDLHLTQERKIQVSHCPAAHTASATELTWALILSLCKKIAAAKKQISVGDWNRQNLLGLELQGKTLGIVGLGRIGTSVARIAQAFGMKVLANDPYQSDEAFQTLGLERLSLEEVLRSSQIVSLHLPLTKETHHMMGEMYIDSMRDDALLINTCRGSVIHEQALIKALEKGKLAGAGLDVFEYEPLARESQLIKLNNVVLTPHIGATTDDAFRKASAESAQKISDFFQNKVIQDLLPGTAPWFDMIS